MHYNIAAINVYTSQRRVIPIKGDLPREKLMDEVAQMNAQAGTPFYYTLTTQEA